MENIRQELKKTANPTEAAFRVITADANTSAKLFEASRILYNVHEAYRKNTFYIQQQLFLQSALRHRDLAKDPILKSKLDNLEQNIREMALKLRPLMQQYHEIFGKHAIQIRQLQLPVIDPAAFKEHEERFQTAGIEVHTLWERHSNTLKLLKMAKPDPAQIGRYTRNTVLHYMEQQNREERRIDERMNLEWNQIELMQGIGAFSMDVLLFSEMNTWESSDDSLIQDKSYRRAFMPVEFVLKEESYLFTIPGEKITSTKWIKGTHFVSCRGQGTWLNVVAEKKQGGFRVMDESYWLHEEIVQSIRIRSDKTLLDRCGIHTYALIRNAAIRNAPGGERVNVFTPYIRIEAVKEGDEWLRILRYGSPTMDWKKPPPSPYWTHISNTRLLGSD